MNVFEFNSFEVNKGQATIYFPQNEDIFLKLDNVTRVDDCLSGDYMYREYKDGGSQWLIMYKCQDERMKTVIIKIYTCSDVTFNNAAWMHHLDVPLTELIQAEGLQLTSVVFCHFYSNTGVFLAVFKSLQSLHVARIDILSKMITDKLFFSLASVFYPRDNVFTDFVVSSDSNSMLLLDQTSSPKIPYCPSVLDLQSVLNLRLSSGVYSLISFWSTELVEIHRLVSHDSWDSLHHGLPSLHYLSFLHVHQSVLLSTMVEYFHNDTCLGSVSNIFLEQISNMVNDYLHQVINLLLRWRPPSENIHTGVHDDVVQNMLDMLCYYSRIFRGLVLTSRSTLRVYQSLSKHVPKSVPIEKSRLIIEDEVDRIRTMDEKKVVSECLRSRIVSLLQSGHGKKTEGSCVTEEDMVRCSESIIVTDVLSLDWRDLRDLISDLGHKPTNTLVSLCNITKVKKIRDYLYNQLNLGQQSREYKIAKDLIDKLEVAYTAVGAQIRTVVFDSISVGHHDDGDVTRHLVSGDIIHSFLDKLDKPKCQSLTEVLSKHISDKSPSSQFININLDLFLDLQKTHSDDQSGTWLSEQVDLCVMDADYRRMLLDTKNCSHHVTHERMITWIQSWRKNVSLFVRYVIQSCNIDLINMVLDWDLSGDHIMEERMIEEMIHVIYPSSSPHLILYTDLDRDIIHEAFLHVLIRYPESLITTLEHVFSGDSPRIQDMLQQISHTLPIHLLCPSQCCPLRSSIIKESQSLDHINMIHIERLVNHCHVSEFPIILYYLLSNYRGSPIQFCAHSNDSIRKVALLHSSTSMRNPVDIFSLLISRNILELKDSSRVLNPESLDLDEVAYVALLSGITYDEINGNSSNEVVVSISRTLTEGNYWDLVRKRLLRPRGYDKHSEDTIDQYYEVNMYDFLYRTGTMLSLDHIFSSQPSNHFSKDKTQVSGDTTSPCQSRHIPLINKKHTTFTEDANKSLNYTYYLSLGRPFQAYSSIEREFGTSARQGLVPLDVINEVVKNIYQLALLSIDDECVIGGCFGLLRLIGSTTDLLRCYLTLVEWVIDWHVQVNDQTDLSGSTQSQHQPAACDVRRHYAAKTAALFSFCLSVNSSERRNSRRLIIRQLEEIFVWRLKSLYYQELSEILKAWSLVLYFCQSHGIPSSTVILQFYAKQNQWLLFLCIAQIFGYSKDQVKETLNLFEDSSIRHHMGYIISKVHNVVSLQTPISTKTEDTPRNDQPASDPLKRIGRSLSGSSVSSVTTGVYFKDTYGGEYAVPSKDSTTFNLQSQKKYSLVTLSNSAKTTLFELIFDCQVDTHVRTESMEDQVKSVFIRLNPRKLLAYCLALSHPFLAVIAYSVDSPSKDDCPPSTDSSFSFYLNCLACFIVSSSPRKVQEALWIKWAGLAKLDWSEDEFLDLVVFAIESKFATVVSDAFAVLKDERFVFLDVFYSMIGHGTETFNPVLRDLFLGHFVGQCTSLCMSDSSFLSSAKDRRRPKCSRNTKLLFMNRLLGTSLLSALQLTAKGLGGRVLLGWLSSLSHSITGLLQSYVKALFPFQETNVLLLFNVLSLYFDFIDLDSSVQVESPFKNEDIPVNTKGKEFIQFIERFMNHMSEKLISSYDYTKDRLAKKALVVVDQINSLHSVQLPTNRDKWKDNEAKLRSMCLRKVDPSFISGQALTDLVSMALAGQTDKLESMSLSRYEDATRSTDTTMDDDMNTVLHHGLPRTNVHGYSDCWRRLVIPEEWQDVLLNLPTYTIDVNLELVNHAHVLLNEKKWIEACSYMIEHEFVVKDAVLILTSMKVACGKMDPTKLPTFIRDYCKSQQVEMIVKESVNKLPVRRMSVIMSSMASKLNLMVLLDNDSNGGNKNSRQSSKSVDTCQQFLTKVTEVLIHGQELVEYICTMYCVATKMSESYTSVAQGEEFDVLTKILVGTCRDKIDTADMYLGVVDINADKLCHFIAEVIIHVLRLEIQTFIGSTSIINSSTSFQYSTSLSPIRSKSHVGTTPSFSISPNDNVSFQSCISPSQHSGSRRSAFTIQSHISVVSLLHEHTLKVAERCQLRSDWRTIPSQKTKSESRLIKTFTLQDILLLSPNARKLGKILFNYYQRFSQEVFSCIEDAEFLVHLLIQCHNCFTEGGDTIGISNCLKAAKELTRSLNTNGYFVLMAQLLCRIGRYGEMPYIFSNLIENHEFEQLFRKDMDKEGVIVPYVFDYLNRYHAEDYEKIEMVCLKYNCFYELAETKSKMASFSITKLRTHFGSKSIKESAKMLTSSIINNLLEASKNYLKAGCYKKMEDSFRKAQLFKLQQRWLEDPDKTFTVGPFNKPGKPASSKVTLPETGLPYGVRIIDLTKEQALIFLKKIPVFYTAFILHDQLKLSPDVWVDLLVHHGFLYPDETYLSHYLLYFGPMVTSNFIQQCLNRLEKSTMKLPTNKQALLNLKMMLSRCNDVFFVKRISDTYKLPN